MLIDQMNQEMVAAILETIPAEVTVIDHNDEVAGWNRHDQRLFKRPLTSMGVNFRQCHPESSLPMVERIVDEMRRGRRDVARFWIDMTVPDDSVKHKILIEFYALRNPAGKYLGCMEFTQDVEPARRLEGQKRLLD